MQDGASCHAAILIKDWFEWVGIDYIKDWPGNSPDLNPIENLWAIMKARLKDCDTSSVPKLEAAIRQIWSDLGRTDKHIIGAIMKARLKNRDTSSVPKLEAAICQIWSDLGSTNKHIIQNLALSVPDRLTEVITRKGRPTKY